MRTKKVLEMRLAGHSLQAIANEMGYNSQQAVHGVISRAIYAIPKAAAQEMRAVESERLDVMLLTAWDQAKNGDLAAVDRVMKVMERRARLFGLDKLPEPADDATRVEHGLTAESVQAVKALLGIK